MQYNRPNPESLLRQIEAQEQEIKKSGSVGKLKIFLGFCAGVGKTYAMLEEARLASKNGVNIQIGIVETHGRKETEALLEGLHIIPRRKIKYNGLDLSEMDIDEILKQKPSIVVVDELAHTNAYGSRHAKRYQDVEEILKAGINVYTTLNIQHIESLVDIVRQISDITVRETLPDSFIKLADEIELIDLTPEKLLKRLSQGKIYIPDKAQIAMQKFFKKGNLLALRELALTYTAKRVDNDMLYYKNKNAIATPWPVNSKLLVGFSSSPTSERLLRITHRMASDMNAQWYAVYVESPQQVEINTHAEAQLKKNIKLAEELGAKVVSLSGNVIADVIINFAKEKNIALIVAGLSHRSRFEEIFKGSVLNELTKKSGKINVLIVGSTKTPSPKIKIDTSKDFKPYLISAASIASIILVCCILRDYIAPLNVAMFLLLPVILSSIFFGTRAGIFTSLTAILTFDFFIVPPILTFGISDVTYLPGFLVFIIISLIISALAKNIRWQTDSSRHKERFLASLNAFTKETLLSSNMLETAVSHISEAFRCETVILLPDKKGALALKAKKGNTMFDSKEYAVAHWVFKNGTCAGYGSDTLATAKWKYLPLKIEDEVFGVVGVTKNKDFSSEQEMLLESFSGIIAMYLRKVQII